MSSAVLYMSMSLDGFIGAALGGGHHRRLSITQRDSLEDGGGE
jgi:hypothetical protein